MTQDKVNPLLTKAFLALGITTLFFASPPSFAMPGGDLKEEEVGQSDLTTKVFENKDLTQLIIDHFFASPSSFAIPRDDLKEEEVAQPDLATKVFENKDLTRLIFDYLSNRELARSLNIYQDTNNAAEYRKQSILVSELLHTTQEVTEDIESARRHIKTLNNDVNAQSKDIKKVHMNLDVSVIFYKYDGDLEIEILNFQNECSEFHSLFIALADNLFVGVKYNDRKLLSEALVYASNDTILKWAKNLLKITAHLEESLGIHQTFIQREYSQQSNKLPFWKKASDHLSVLTDALRATKKTTEDVSEIKENLNQILAHLNTLKEIYSVLIQMNEIPFVSRSLTNN